MNVAYRLNLIAQMLSVFLRKQLALVGLLIAWIQQYVGYIKLSAILEQKLTAANLTRQDADALEMHVDAVIL